MLGSINDLSLQLQHNRPGYMGTRVQPAHFCLERIFQKNVEHLCVQYIDTHMA